MTDDSDPWKDNVVTTRPVLPPDPPDGRIYGEKYSYTLRNDGEGEVEIEIHVDCYECQEGGEATFVLDRETLLRLLNVRPKT